MSEKQDKPTICLDFDGVLHSYESGWKGIDVIPDPPVPGAFEALAKYVGHFRVCIYSSRSSSPEGIAAMKGWVVKHELPKAVFDQLEWPTQKPPALYGLDDRVETFEGTFPSVEHIFGFKPWNKRERVVVGASDYEILKYFTWEHLKSERLQEVSRRFSELAYQLAAELPRCAETSVALRKLLESKDAAVRAAVGAPKPVTITYGVGPEDAEAAQLFEQIRNEREKSKTARAITITQEPIIIRGKPADEAKVAEQIKDAMGKLEGGR